MRSGKVISEARSRRHLNTSPKRRRQSVYIWAIDTSRQPKSRKTSTVSRIFQFSPAGNLDALFIFDLRNTKFSLVHSYVILYQWSTFTLRFLISQSFQLLLTTYSQHTVVAPHRTNADYTLNPTGKKLFQEVSYEQEFLGRQ